MRTMEARLRFAVGVTGFDAGTSSTSAAVPVVARAVATRRKVAAGGGAKAELEPQLLCV